MDYNHVGCSLAFCWLIISFSHGLSPCMKVFSIFEDLGISVAVSTSEVSISLTLDPSKLWSRAIGWSSSVVAELWGLRDGLILCSQLDIEAIEIELDGKAVVCLLSSNSGITWWICVYYWWLQELNQEYSKKEIMHCFREANSQEHDFVLIDVPPSESDVLLLLYLDKLGMYFDSTQCYSTHIYLIFYEISILPL